jgi:hypothetical protein
MLVAAGETRYSSSFESVLYGVPPLAWIIHQRKQATFAGAVTGKECRVDASIF